MMFGAMTRKLRERGESVSYSLWKKLQAIIKEMTFVFPAPVAIFNT